MKSGGPIQWLQTKDRLNMNKVKQQKPAHSKFEFKILSADFHNWEASTTCFFFQRKNGNVECWSIFRYWQIQKKTDDFMLKFRSIAPFVRFARIATMFFAA